MKKIQTIFDRDWDGNKGVVDKLAVDFDFDTAIATEKLDGTNVKLTVRNHYLVRLEKRRGPDKYLKEMGIADPWYVDVDRDDPADQYIQDAAINTDLSDIPDGEWQGEAVGPKIQGNPLNLERRFVFLFSVQKISLLACFDNAPSTFDELRAWLPKQRSKVGDGFIEGIVWHSYDPVSIMVKIKVKDFK